MSFRKNFQKWRNDPKTTQATTQKKRKSSQEAIFKILPWANRPKSWWRPRPALHDGANRASRKRRESQKYDETQNTQKLRRNICFLSIINLPRIFGAKPRKEKVASIATVGTFRFKRPSFGKNVREKLLDDTPNPEKARTGYKAIWRRFRITLWDYLRNALWVNSPLSKSTKTIMSASTRSSRWR